MASRPGSQPDFDLRKCFAAGDPVEVVDASNKLFGKVGIVVFFVADNIYVKFPELLWSPTKMFFPEQLRAADTPQEVKRIVNASTLLSGFGSRCRRYLLNKRDR